MKSYYQSQYIIKGERGKYTLRDNLYRKIIYIIKDYQYYQDIISGEAEDDLLWTADEHGSVVEKEAVPVVDCKIYLEAIDEALKVLPDYIYQDVIDHVLHNRKYVYCDAAHEQTLKKWTQRFIWYVAHNLGEV